MLTAMQNCAQVVTYEKIHRIVYLFIQLVPWLCIAALGIRLRALWMLGQHCTTELHIQCSFYSVFETGSYYIAQDDHELIHLSLHSSE